MLPVSMMSIALRRIICLSYSYDCCCWMRRRKGRKKKNIRSRLARHSSDNHHRNKNYSGSHSKLSLSPLVQTGVHRKERERERGRKKKKQKGIKIKANGGQSITINKMQTYLPLGNKSIRCLRLALDSRPRLPCLHSETVAPVQRPPPHFSSVAVAAAAAAVQYMQIQSTCCTVTSLLSLRGGGKCLFLLFLFFPSPHRSLARYVVCDKITIGV